MSDLSTAAYRALLRELREVWRRNNAPCWICGQPIDYSLPFGDKEALELDHVKPRKTHPHLLLVPSNCRPSHSRCNRAKGASTVGPALGDHSEEW
ncbi:HNH endonuclease [Microbacterium schleiferi]|uniref:HNH endonuclease n=1 Tax=Microbacterium schleiferi TaxID=69362 RepID=A0A7S8MVQ5_9MICO|nr:HNH endonuclease [Microbacterium schleiferi]